MIVRAVTVGTANVVASPARQREYLAILNQSPTATLYVAFDRAAVAAPTAGQLTIGPLTVTTSITVDTANTVTPSMVFSGPQTTPWGAVNLIASAAGTPVTVLE